MIIPKIQAKKNVLASEILRNPFDPSTPSPGLFPQFITESGEPAAPVDDAYKILQILEGIIFIHADDPVVSEASCDIHPGRAPLQQEMICQLQKLTVAMPVIGNK